jgi:hypothetical protein
MKIMMIVAPSEAEYEVGTQRVIEQLENVLPVVDLTLVRADFADICSRKSVHILLDALLDAANEDCARRGLTADLV